MTEVRTSAKLDVFNYDSKDQFFEIHTGIYIKSMFIWFRNNLESHQ